MKSLHTVLAESIDKMTKAQRDKYYESKPKGASVEVLINCASAVLTGKVKESAPVTKNNGASHNGRVTEFTESDNSTITETAFARADDVMYKAMNLSESDIRKLKNLPPVGVTLTPTQLREFRIIRSYRINEADAVRLALKVA